MSKMIGVISKADWSKAPDGATHVRSDNAGWYRYDCATELYILGSRGEDHSMYASVEDFNSAEGSKLISKEEDLGMNTKEVSKQVSCIEDLQTGMFVFMQFGGSAYVNIGDRGRIGFLFTNQYTDVNYAMQSCFDGLDYSPNSDINITHWGYSLAGERYPVATSEANIKIKELEATIALAQKQLQEYKGIK